MKSIKNRLIISFSALILVLSLALGLVSYQAASRGLVNSVERDLQLIAKESAGFVQASIQGELGKLEVLARSSDIASPDVALDAKLGVMKAETEKSGHLDMYIIGRDGVGTSIDSDVLDLSDREYFQRAMNGESTVSDPIVSKEDGSIIIVYAAPIRSAGEVTGVLIAIRDGNALSDVTNAIEIGESGYAYIINDKGDVIGHKDSQLVMDKYNFIEAAKSDESMEALANLTQKMMNGEKGTGRYTFRGISKIIQDLV